MPDSSTPNHSEPEELDSAERPRLRLKLKPLTPAVKPVPVPEPVPESPAPETPGAEQTHNPPDEAAPVPEPEPAEPAAPPPPPPQDPAPVPPAAQPDQPEQPRPIPQAASAAAPAARRQFPWLRLAIAATVCALVTLAIILIPSGREPAPMPDVPPSATVADAPAASRQAPATGGPVASPARLAEAPQSLREFLQALQQSRLVASSIPRGLFVDTVFIPEGALVSPELGISLESVQFEDAQAIILFSRPQEGPIPIHLPLP